MSAPTPHIPMTPREFWDECQRFDWFFDYSDDARVWRRGVAESERLLAHAPEGSENRRIWDAWKAYMFNGPHFGTETQPKPVRP